MKVAIKRRYFEFRQGNVTLSPILQFANFLMLSYLVISDTIPFYIFVPLFILTILITYTVVGNRFRKIQTPTDLNLSYEKATQAAVTVCQLMKSQLVIMKELKIKIPNGYEKRLEYMKKISEGKK